MQMFQKSICIFYYDAKEENKWQPKIIEHYQIPLEIIQEYEKLVL